MERGQVGPRLVAPRAREPVGRDRCDDEARVLLAQRLGCLAVEHCVASVAADEHEVGLCEGAPYIPG